MSESQAAVIRQLRTDNARLLGTLRLADTMPFPVPNAPTITIDLRQNPDRNGMWSVVRYGWQEPVTLNVDGIWTPLADTSACDQYVWHLADALEQVPVLLEVESRAHAGWRRAHEQAARARNLAQVADEFLEPVREAKAVAESAVA
jgi:hypothetical protein